MARREIKSVFGGGPIGEGKDFPDAPMIEQLYRLLEEGGCHTIDTGRLYSNSEEWIGKTHGGDRFIIDSKTPGGFVPGGSSSEGILKHAKETVERLGVESVSRDKNPANYISDVQCRSMCIISTVRIPLSTSWTCSRVSTMRTRLGVSSASG
jgi:hypothetical protein